MTSDQRDTKAAKRLLALKTEWGTWRAVAERLNANVGEVHGAATSKRAPSRRLLLALGIVKAEHRSGIRVRMSKDEAMALVRGQVSLALENRVRYQLWGRK